MATSWGNRLRGLRAPDILLQVATVCRWTSVRMRYATPQTNAEADKKSTLWAASSEPLLGDCIFRILSHVGTVKAQHNMRLWYPCSF
jgi:hypothetical protein